jgi:hypothetical protein
VKIVPRSAGQIFMKSKMHVMPLNAIKLVSNILQSARTYEAEGTSASQIECGDYGKYIVLTIVTSITKMTIFFHLMQWVHSTASSGCQGTKNMSGN